MASQDTVAVTVENFDAEVIHAKVPVLVDFWASWCGPCKMIAPVLEEIAREKAGSAKVAKVNIDEGDNQQIAARYGVQALPTMMLFRDGQPVGKPMVGAQVRKSELIGKLEALAG